MPVEQRDGAALVSGYLDTEPSPHAHSVDSVLVHAPDPFDADLRPHRFGVMNACDISGGNTVQVCSLVSPAIRASAPVLGLLLSGSGAFEQHGRSSSLAPGEFVLYAPPFRLALTGPYRYLVLALDPANTLLLRQVRHATANPHLPHNPSGRILSATLSELADTASLLGPLSRQEMGEHISCLLRTVIRDLNRDAAPARPVPLFDRILDYLDRHLAEDLAPARIATAHHISVRYLHRLFQDHGDTVSDHIRRRRLDRIRRDLTDPVLADQPAYAIAARWGLHDPSHFSKLFKAEFATSPSRLRQQPSTDDGSPP
ncbi:AraC-like DNA-binding protein [Kibdelosporangium banguiense]|uniref:AraC-like DNA-binding protein n=1 Tax=Kibdelosporangium banguiense TaxID=1365924 RepID=A0ABS4TVE9_9PSEU|nr:helix-turn-helix domain-containing protein [Kibdelosporangium banguiense]MBP2328367.1 AraC-like DNA-binding protein [Kibdelosporangium banguiense]